MSDEVNATEPEPEHVCVQWNADGFCVECGLMPQDGNPAPTDDPQYDRRLADALQAVRGADTNVPLDERVKWAAEDYKVKADDLTKGMLPAAGDSPDRPRSLPAWQRRELYKMKKFWEPYFGKFVVVQLYDHRLALGTLVDAHQSFIILENATIKSSRNKSNPTRLNIDRHSIMHFHESCDVEKADRKQQETQQKFILETVRRHIHNVGLKGLLGTIAEGLRPRFLERPQEKTDVE